MKDESYIWAMSKTYSEVELLTKISRRKTHPESIIALQTSNVISEVNKLKIGDLLKDGSTACLFVFTKITNISLLSSWSKS